jgi:hypothetical protein
MIYKRVGKPHEIVLHPSRPKEEGIACGNQKGRLGREVFLERK